MTVRTWIATALLIAGSAALPVGADTFVFTAIPDQDERRLNERFGKVADYLAEKLDVEVDYIPVKSYPAAVSAFRNNQVQMAWFGGLTGVQARQLVPGSQAIAQGEEDTAFKTYFIAHESTGLEPDDTLTEQLRDHSFTFGSKGSTSGRLMPEFYLRETFGRAPEDLFNRVGFSGDHSRTIALVESGAYDVGAVNYAVWEAEVEAGDVDTDAVDVIWATPAYPDYQWTIRGDADARFGDGFTARVQQALLTMTDPDLLAAFPRSGFIPAENADYAPIERTAVTIGIMDAQ